MQTFFNAFCCSLDNNRLIWAKVGQESGDEKFCFGQLEFYGYDRNYGNYKYGKKIT